MNTSAEVGARKRSQRGTTQHGSNAVNKVTARKAAAAKKGEKIGGSIKASTDVAPVKGSRSRLKRGLPNPPELQDESSLQVKLKIRREKIETMEKLGIQCADSDRKLIES